MDFHFLSNYYSDLSPSASGSSSSSSPILDTQDIGTSAAIEDEILLASSNPKKRAGRKKFRETRHPVFRGIRRRNSGKWVCEVREPNKSTRIWLGTFPTIEMAARAHDVAALALRGRSACLNFADSAWRFRIPNSTDPKEIQRAAAEAAEEFRPDILLLPPVELELELDREEDVFTFPTNEKVLFMGDDDHVLSGFCADVGELGPMLSPPHHTEFYFKDNDVELYHDVSLWNY